jgi:hypothetical protein
MLNKFCQSIRYTAVNQKSLDFVEVILKKTLWETGKISRWVKRLPLETCEVFAQNYGHFSPVKTSQVRNAYEIGVLADADRPRAQDFLQSRLFDRLSLQQSLH